jgi:hypothetical protein
MKKTRYYPFERNRYFYGKLLTVRDFESEQKYFNDKRRMMNRLLHGTGVITGLQVIAVDDKSVSVEMGAAIDALGREIVVPSPVTLKLSMMEGFTNNEYAKNVYLCIAYDEKGKEPVHSVANSSVRADEVSEYNRMLESYRLFIQEEAPNPSSLPLSDLQENKVVLYQDSQIRVLQTTPLYVNPGQLFEMKISIEKTLQAGKVFFEYDLALDRMEAPNGSKVTFRESQDQQETEYELKVQLRADSTVSVKGSIGVKTQAAVLRIGDTQLDGISGERSEISIIQGSISERLMDDYVKHSLEASLDSPSDPCIYLAKIGLLQMGPTYVIERVEQVPFDEYVYNSSVMHKLSRLKNEGQSSGLGAFTARSKVRSLRPGQEPELKVSYDTNSSELSFDLGIPSNQSAVDGIQTGVIDIPVVPFTKMSVSPFGKASKSFVSQEIEHGLGEGHVMIITSIVEQTDNAISGMLANGESEYFGSADVFNGSEYEADLPEMKLGTVAYPQKGTFRIGVKIQQGTETTRVRVRWWAYKQNGAAAIDSGAKDSIDEAMASIMDAAAGSENG